jgi:hypothetical protein
MNKTPRRQNTAREVRFGMLFLAYAKDMSAYTLPKKNSPYGGTMYHGFPKTPVMLYQP